MAHRWLVTGAHGFLGANAVRMLAATPNTVVVAATRDHADLTDPQAVRDLLAAHSPDFVLNTAAMASHPACQLDPAAALAINAGAVDVLARECTDRGAKLIQVSTDAVFDGQRGDYRESDPTSPTTVYGESKLQGEVNALANNAALVIRTNFFGWSPTGQRSILEFFVNNLSHGNPVRGFTDTITTSLYASDLLERIFALRNVEGIIHLTSSDAISKLDYALLVAETFGLSPAPITATPSPDGPKNISLNTDTAHRLLGSSLPTQRDGLSRAVQERAAIQFRELH